MPKKQQEPFKVVVVGDGGAVKTALIHMFVFSKFVDEYEPTTADSFRKSISLDGTPCNVDILDTAGQDEIMREQYYKTGEGFLCVYTINETRTFDSVNKFRDQIVNVKDNEKVPFVLVGNKSDLDSTRQVSKSDGQCLSEKWRCTFFETSAKLNANVTESFEDLVRQIKKVKDVARQTQPETCHCVLL